MPVSNQFSGFYYKCFKDELLQALQNMKNFILQGGKMPETWKDTNVALISKKDRVWFWSNEPTSPFNNVYKLFPMLVADRLKIILQECIDGVHESFYLKDN